MTPMQMFHRLAIVSNNCPRWAQTYRERALAAVADGAWWHVA